MMLQVVGLVRLFRGVEGADADSGVKTWQWRMDLCCCVVDAFVPQD